MSATPVKAYVQLFEAISRFVTNNNTFGSSIVDTRATSMIGNATSLNEAAMVPSKLCIFGFDDAIKFGFVIWALAGDCRAEDPTFPTFDLDAHFTFVKTVYDISMVEQIDSLLEDEDEDEDEAESESNGSADGEDGEDGSEGPALPEAAE